MRSQLLWSIRLALFGLLLASAGFTQDITEPESYLRLNYAKREVQIPMRDGVKLFTAIYSPRDVSRRYPMLMIRTPYGVKPYGEHEFPKSLGPSMHFAREGYIFVYQDVRGRHMSEGKFIQVTPHIADKKSPDQVDESSDTYDTIEWLLKNVPGHNGRAEQWGISYPGFYCSAGMIDAHPSLKAVSPQAPVGDWFFDDFFHHGAFFLAHGFRWLSANGNRREKPTTNEFTPFKFPTRDGYQFFLDIGPVHNADEKYLKRKVDFWTEMMQHPNYDDFWKRRNILPHLKRVAPAVMTVTGWYDAEDLYGSFETYRHVERQNPGVNNVLVVGPWVHGGWSRTDGDRLGAIDFGSKTAEFYRRHIELPFFNKYLKDADVPPPAEATAFETGGNRWRTFDAWPPRGLQARVLYARPRGKLADKPPAKTSSSSQQMYDEFVSDPNRPVPYVETVSPSMTNEYMVDDQRFAARRPDVLVYQTDVLAEDLTLAGRVQAELWVSTSQADADWVVKLIDVFPDDHPNSPYTPPHQSLNGYQMLVRSEVIRGRFRNSYEKPEPFRPGEPAKVSLVLQDVLHRFKKGHRVMVQIQSTWFPLVDRNPQKWVENIFFAKPEDFVKATHRVYHAPERATCLKFEVLPDKKTPGAEQAQASKSADVGNDAKPEDTSAASGRIKTWRYLRPAASGFEEESEIRRERGEDRHTITSVTRRGKQTLTVAARFDPRGELRDAIVDLRPSKIAGPASVTVADGKATVRRTGQSPVTLDCPPGIIVTSAPDWTDAVLTVAGYDPAGKTEQVFPGLWIHPLQEPARLTFKLTRQGSDEVTRDGRAISLLRLLLELRGGSKYVVWRNQAGELVRLIPEGKPEQGIVLAGWEKATAELGKAREKD